MGEGGPRLLRYVGWVSASGELLCSLKRHSVLLASPTSNGSRIVPTAGIGNEDVVLRVLSAGEPMPLNQLRMSERNLRQFRAFFVIVRRRRDERQLQQLELARQLGRHLEMIEAAGVERKLRGNRREPLLRLRGQRSARQQQCEKPHPHT